MNMNKLLKKGIFVGFLTFGGHSFAEVQWKDFNQEAYQKATKTNSKILLGFHKIGCGTCASQDKSIEEAGVNKIPDLIRFRVERKNPKMDVIYKKFSLNKKQWGAMVYLKGNKEVARVKPGNTNKKQIKEFVNSIYR